ncbi:MAG: hypothetical protein IKO94_04275 [Selenomonadaceae bacterium]|nr:hypothetical protein [Selenomonadaceae bacterium]
MRSVYAQVSYYITTGKKIVREDWQRKYETAIPKYRKTNSKRAVRYLEALVHTNFGQGDLLLSLTYEEENAPKDEKEAKKKFSRFMNRVNYRQKKMGLENAKWVSVLELTKRGIFHHHVIIQCGLSRDELEKVWGLGRANTKRLQPDRNEGLGAVVKYIAKEFIDDGKPKNKRSWDCSKNLLKPWDTVNDNPRMMSKKKFNLMKEIPTDCDFMKQIIEGDNPGYKLVEVERTHIGETGEYHFFCRLRLSTEKSTNNPQPMDKMKKEEGHKCKKTSRYGNARAKPPPGDTGPP